MDKFKLFMMIAGIALTIICYQGGDYLAAIFTSAGATFYFTEWVSSSSAES